MKKLALLPVCLLVCLTLHAQTEYVNPFIGTTNFGACNPGAVTPNGLMSVTPGVESLVRAIQG